LNIVPYLLNQCKDFRDEKTDLEYMVEELGVELDTDCTFCICACPLDVTLDPKSIKNK
jgi:hypothetical protein